MPVVMTTLRTPAADRSRSWRETMVSPGAISVMALGCSRVRSPMREPRPEFRISAFMGHASGFNQDLWVRIRRLVK